MAFERIPSFFSSSSSGTSRSSPVSSAYSDSVEKLQLISPLLTEQIYQDLLEGRIGDYSEKIAACNIKDALYVVISTQSDFPGSSLDIALYAQI